ncbi:helix-turn-helix domain-containing protein [Paeniglutamicibacter terrestris]|uniref:Helix-turn-helix domain-containing protein n=1 Tax=Paeniglutamicibacter terrestris TaxID=2723403 RepID=A0ABX1G6A0_9MICC|nr:helix-turn-helix domain-containing protein [Paeniglutamicibacter terrestris]NKG21050.1 helix-turn-helix domain-containing protein [Paeniglutamicibacter terrestris]
MEQFFKADAVADLTEFTITTVWRKCRDKQWPHHRLGRSYRFTAEDIREIQEQMRAKPVSVEKRGKRQAI